jgi:hypothetical protein
MKRLELRMDQAGAWLRKPAPPSPVRSLMEAWAVAACLVTLTLGLVLAVILGWWALRGR